MAAAEIGVPASTAATGRDAADPTMPYRYPFGPLPRKQRMAATRVAAMGPPVPAPTLDELQDVRARAAALAEEERFSQAAEALEAALRSAVGDYGAKHPKLLELRLDFANMLVLGGNYRRALPQFERLAGYLAERLGSDDELVWYCRAGRHLPGRARRRHARPPVAPGAIDRPSARNRRGLARPVPTAPPDRGAHRGSRRGGDARRQLGSLLADVRRVRGPASPDAAEIEALLTHLVRLEAGNR